MPGGVLAMRYSRKYPNVFHTSIMLSDPDHASAFWLMHHATIALIDALRAHDTATVEQLRPIVDNAHERLETLTAVIFS
jgi:hypothetical protein